MSKSGIFFHKIRFVDLQVMRSVGTTSLSALAHPAVGLAMSGTIGVAGGALLGLLLAAAMPGALRPRVPETAILRCATDFQRFSTLTKQPIWAHQSLLGLRAGDRHPQV